MRLDETWWNFRHLVLQDSWPCNFDSNFVFWSSWKAVKSEKLHRLFKNFSAAGREFQGLSSPVSSSSNSNILRCVKSIRFCRQYIYCRYLFNSPFFSEEAPEITEKSPYNSIRFRTMNRVSWMSLASASSSPSSKGWIGETWRNSSVVLSCLYIWLTSLGRLLLVQNTLDRQGHW